MKRISFFILFAVCITAFSPAQTAEPFRQEGIASWYGGEFDGKPTASGEIFNAALFSAAHPTLPFGTVLLVTNKQNNRQVVVRVNDRGPFVAARIIDLSRAAAEVLDMLTTGTAPVTVYQVFGAALGPVKAPPVISSPIIPLDSAEPAVTAAASPAAAQMPGTGIPPAESAGTLTERSAPLTGETSAMYPAPAAQIRGGIPPRESAKFYRLQVGAYKVPRYAVEAFDKLKNAGLNPAYEKNGDFYRVVLASLKAGDIPSIAQTLGNAGFREAIIREE